MRGSALACHHTITAMRGAAARLTFAARSREITASIDNWRRGYFGVRSLSLATSHTTTSASVRSMVVAVAVSLVI